jgi:glucokinase
MRLIADVGGTNSRMALSQAGHMLPETARSYSNDNWDNFYAIMADYLSNSDTSTIEKVVLAVAGPVHGDRAHLTNRKWVFEADLLAQQCGVKDIYLFNDLTALGYAVPKLRPDQLRVVASGAPKQEATSNSLVVGIGTGFNVSPVWENRGSVVCPPVEAGHISMPFSIIKQLQKLGFDQEQFQTIEALFSGRGFAVFCQDLTGDAELRGPAAIAAYQAGKNREVTTAIDHYSTLLGHLLHDLSLAYMPSSGIYLAGGVARSIITVSPAACLDAYEQPASILAGNTAPLWMICDDLAALTGCAQFTPPA